MGAVTRSVALAAQDMGKLLLTAVAAAPIDPSYYAQVAAHMIDADTALFSGKYRTPLTDVFVARKILPAQAVQALAKPKRRASAPARGMAAMATRPAVATATHTVELNAKKFGLAKPIICTAPIERKPMNADGVEVFEQSVASQQRNEFGIDGRNATEHQRQVGCEFTNGSRRHFRHRGKLLPLAIGLKIPMGQIVRLVPQLDGFDHKRLNDGE